MSGTSQSTRSVIPVTRERGNKNVLVKQALSRQLNSTVLTLERTQSSEMFLDSIARRQLHMCCSY
jgi:hypothetical protein